jgi:hypothetical protein
LKSARRVEKPRHRRKTHGNALKGEEGADYGRIDGHRGGYLASSCPEPAHLVVASRNPVQLAMKELDDLSQGDAHATNVDVSTGSAVVRIANGGPQARAWSVYFDVTEHPTAG